MPKTPRRTPFRAFLSFWSRDVPPEALWVAPLALVWLIPLLGALWTLQQAPDWLEPREVQIALAPGQSMILGHDRAQRRDDLWSPYADPQHVRILRTAAGDWRLENVAASKQVLWKSQEAKDYHRVREWRLTPGGNSRWANTGSSWQRPQRMN